MRNGLKKRLWVFLAAFLVLIAVGCAEKDAGGEKKETKNEVSAEQAVKDPKSEEKAVNEFVLKNTKIVKVFAVTHRVHPQSPDLGPFFVVRGIDEKGQRSEVWVKDMKIHEMNYLK